MRPISLFFFLIPVSAGVLSERTAISGNFVRRAALVPLLFLSFFSLQASAALPLQDSQGNPLPTLAPMLQQVTPAVVNISTTTREQVANPLLRDPFFRRFFRIPQEPQFRERQSQSAGSGVIVDSQNGIVITNNHVVKDAHKIQVHLHDGRILPAQLLGKDREVDIAVLKVKAEKLTAIPVANSSRLNVGDFVVAIGNPFGLGQTVTTGVVSALGRSGLGIDGYEDFIQTDASINPGNSGGALVNLAGQLVGINTAILAPKGGSVGIGFAIPSNMAVASARQVVKFGEVRRGTIGIYMQDLSSELASAFGFDPEQKGVLVSNVQRDSSAEAGGMQSGDIVVAVNGDAIESAEELRNAIALYGVGDKVAIDVLRDSRRERLAVEIMPRQSKTMPVSDVLNRLSGATLSNYQGEGVYVKAIKARSAAVAAGLRKGDIIVAVNKRRVRNLEEFKQAAALNSKTLLLLVNRGNASLYFVLRH